MRRQTKVVAVLLLLSNSGQTIASPKNNIEQFSNIVKAGVFACNEQFMVLYGNGIRASEKDAKDSKLELQKQVDDVLKLTPKLKKITTYNNVYNPTENFIRDLEESYHQKRYADRKQLIEWLANSTLAPKWFQQYVKDLIVKLNNERILSSEVTQSHVKIYNSLLAKGRQLTPVTHSQGNLFVNEAYFGIQEPLRQGMGIVSVANPDDVVADRDQQHACTNGQSCRT